MFVKTISKLLFPTLERDLTKAVSSELASASKMTDCFLAPSVYGYEKTSTSSGMGHATSAVHQRETTTTVFEKVHYAVPKQGLFE